MQIPRKLRPLLFIFGLTAGLMGQGLLLMRAHMRAVERRLLEDFRILVFLERGLDADRVKVVEEKLLAHPATAGVRYVDPDESLAEIEAGAPDVAESVALLGENPLPGAFEASLAPNRLGEFEEWLEAARAAEGVVETRHKTLQVEAIRLVQFYARLLSLTLAAAAFIWALAAAWALATAAVLEEEPERVLGEGVRARMLSAASGAAAGAGLLLAAAWPARGVELIAAWPPLWQQAMVVAFAGLSGMFFTGVDLRLSTFSRGRHAGARRLTTAAAFLFCISSADAASTWKQKNQLKEVRQELQTKRRQFTENQRMKEKLESNLSRIRSEERKAKNKLDELKAEEREALSEKQMLSDRISALAKAKSEGERSLGEELGGYARHAASRTDAFGSPSLWEDAFREGAIRTKKVYLAQLREVRGEASRRHHEAALRGAQLSRNRNRTLERLGGVRQEARRTEIQVQRTQTQLAAMRVEIRELEDSARELAALITKLQKSGARAGAAAGAEPAVGQHTLAWPLEGTILTRYGKRRIPELDTWEIRTGIELGAPAGTPVGAVDGGKVIFTGPFRSYGNVVIVDHGRGFYSIYGQLASISVQKGAQVKAGTRLAAAGQLPDGGGRLYLELRQGTKALNPLAWLKKR